MTSKQKTTNEMPFKEYYQHYLKLHTNKINRRLHVLGQLATIVFIITILYLAFNKSLFYLILLAITPFIVYPFAWSGHFFFEKNKPAAFKNPWRAKAADWVMLKDIIIGRVKL